MLEESEGAFDFMALLIKFLIVFTLHDTIAFGRNHRHTALCLDVGDDSIGIVSLVGQQRMKMQTLHQRNRLDTIGFLATRQNKSKWIAECIAHAMDFGGKAAPRAA